LGDGIIEYPGSADKRQFMIFDGQFETETRRLRLNVDAMDWAGMKHIDVNKLHNEPMTQDDIEPFVTRYQPFTRDPWLEFKVDDSYRILGEKRVYPTPVTAVGPYYLPALNIPTYWRWSTIMPIRPPRDDAAR
jgi:hypothetical protein